jgi:hypothetical protein
MFFRFIIPLLFATISIGSLQAHVVLETRLTGAHFKPGDIIRIDWSILVEHDQIDWVLFFSSDGGDTWEPIEEGLPLYQLTYSWPAPEMESTKMLVQIIQHNDVTENYFDISDTFSITSEASTPVIYFDQLAIDAQFYPNPVQNEATLIISHAGNQPIKVMVSNVHGQMLDRLFSEKTQNGDHYYRWQTESFPSGIYQICLQLGDITRSFPILVTH